MAGLQTELQPRGPYALTREVLAFRPNDAKATELRLTTNSMKRIIGYCRTETRLPYALVRELAFRNTIENNEITGDRKKSDDAYGAAPSPPA